MDNSGNKQKEVEKVTESTQQKQIHNEQGENEDIQEESDIKNDSNETKPDEKEKALEERWLDEILNHPIKTLVKKSDNDKEEIVVKLVKDIIDPEKDIWFSAQKKKPIITEPGTRKLILEAGATFPKITPIEKQSDAPSRDREQVWIEATVLFPDGTTHEEYGIANRMNCQSNIAQGNLPIMARKRAMHRAFYRSDYIGLYDVYDENETLDVRDEKNELEIKKIKEKLSQTDLKNKKLINQMCKEIKTPEGDLVWKINDMQKLVQLGKGNSLVSYIAMLRLRHLNNKDKANS